MVDWVDYDAWAAEVDDAAGPTVVVAGQRWTLPGRHQVPAKAVADFQRIRGRLSQMRHLNDDDPVPDDLAEALSDGLQKLTPAELLRALIGEQADEMLAAGASHRVIERLARDYSDYVERGAGPLAGQMPEESQDPEVEGEGSGSATSSTTGRSSKRTSKGNTEST